MLRWGHLVVVDIQGAANGEQGRLDLIHAILDHQGHRREVVQVRLLAAGRWGALARGGERGNM